MKLKIGFGEGGLKGFIVRHAEKVIFGVVLLLVAFFVYSSATQEGITLSETPEKLKSEAQAARSHITADHWRDLAPERVNKVEDYPARAEEIRTPIRDTDYAPDRPLLDQPLTPPNQKRRDPEVFQPIKVEAKGGVYAVAWRLKQPDDAYASDKDAVLKPKEQPKPKRKKRDRRRPMYGGEADYEMMYGGMGSSEEMYGSGGEGYDPYGMGAGNEEEAYNMGSAEMYGGTGIAGVRKVSSFYIEHYVKGFRATMGGARGLVAPKSLAVVSVTALVPYEKQWEEYERALAEAVGYSPQADVPRYLYFMAERAEVTDDPDAPLDWKPVSNTAYALQQAMQFAGFPKEVADLNYVQPNILTMPIPPILLKPYESLGLHSEVPKMQVRSPLVKPPGATEEETPPAETPAEAADLADGLPKLPKLAPGMTSGAGYDMYGTGGSYEMYGAGYGMPGAEGAYGTEGYDMYGTGGEMGYGTGSYGYGAYGTAPGQPRRPLAKYKMIRFFDLSAEVGKSYRYRVRVILEDPNRPKDPKAEPNKRILEPAVVQRLAQVEADDQDYLKRTNKARRTYYIQTDWSDPSEVVRVRANDGFVAGAAEHGRFIKLSTKPGVQGPEVQITESSGKMVVSVWDRRRAVEVPAERDVHRGEYLDFKQSADVMNPLSLQLKTIEDFSFNTGGLVVDLRGGEALIKDVDSATKEETELFTPGEFMVMDGQGNLVVCNEIDDTEEYRRLLFIEDTAQPTSSMMPGSDYSEEMGMDYMYGGGGGYYGGGP